MQAVLNGVVIASSDETIIVEGNHYFPSSSIVGDVLSNAALTTVCPWKGTASYYDVQADGVVHQNAAWYYAEPKDAASQIKDHVAFGAPVRVE